MKQSQIFLIASLAVLLIGAVMSVAGIEPWANYVLVAGALLMIVRGALRSREKEGND